ncbi:uncharacterized protein LOC110239204 isoform X2 [Exaiptasia diaphana]|nr:uncharacterized protein LOC110239204 isoform X2 [Exaiptasia diaphana]
MHFPIVLFFIVLQHFSGGASSELKCYSCGTGLVPDVPAGECSASKEDSVCLTSSGFDRCFSRFVTKTHKYSNITEIVLFKGCGLSAFCG